MKIAVADSYVQARYDYGPFARSPLGIAFHMTEGNGDIGDVNYLARNPSRGVSAHFVILKDGTIVQMLDITHAAGTMNPDDRATADKGYYGGDIFRSVLGSAWTDPNAVLIQTEIGGRAIDGPTARQVTSCIRLGNALRALVPSLRGAVGHADQTDTKRCPGTTTNMRTIFDGVGGHGLWSDRVGLRVTMTNATGRVRIPKGTDSIRIADGMHYVFPIEVTRPAIAAQLLPPNGSVGYIVDANGDELHFIRRQDLPTDAFTPTPTTTEELETANETIAALNTQLAAFRTWRDTAPE